ncbi:hypothetical protein [Corallococcus llansteffanensis]|uniref:HEAT repeat domain-containing protein n=1 Tax=Corallococcus llansteffanensis TaxID=2316731 RepID=A0A3A8Q554_9BACT|nr:hypothetical protein [Corallococcus llansteffanensis]RKH63258.1 hypothetical protein D7V93_08990 [Corallococcus llansteffanensis]
MDPNTSRHFANLRGQDADVRYASFRHVMEVTQQPVEWAAEVWEDLLALLREGDNHQRAIAAQVLSNLARSDTQGRMLKDLDRLMAVTKDEKFVTARHSLQTLWRVATASKPLQAAVVDRLTRRFRECLTEKNGTLIRYDILEVFRKTYDVAPDESLKELALKLIETEEDPKYRKKYAGLWKDLVAKPRGAKKPAAKRA